MSVLSNKDIKKMIKSGDLVCHPIDEKNIAEASLDFTLGYYFYVQEFQEDFEVYNPFDQDEVVRYFKGPLKAISHKEWCQKNNQPAFKNIPDEHPVIVLKPGERILAHTHEFIGARPQANVAAQVLSRSTWGRNGVAVCFDAGWIDPGYINRVTLEIYNLNKHESVVLPIGERIGQLVFHRTGEVEGGYTDGRTGISGKYQHSDDLETLIKDWRPEMMLPKAFKDVRSLPQPITNLAEGLL